MIKKMNFLMPFAHVRTAVIECRKIVLNLVASAVEEKTILWYWMELKDLK